MPIYEYRCSQCGNVHEVMQKFSDKPLTRCPDCRGRMTKMISNCAFHLKGSGWYVTDYKKGNSGWKEKAPGEKKDEMKSDPPKSDAGETKKESKAEKESKPEAKPA